MKTRRNTGKRLAWAACSMALPALLLAQPANPKYNWLNHYYSNTTADEGRAIAYHQPVGGSAVVFAAGTFTQSITIGAFTLNAVGGPDDVDIWVAKFSTTGVVLAATSYGSQADLVDEAWDLAVSPSKSGAPSYVYVAGRHWGVAPLLMRYNINLSGAPLMAEFGNGLTSACNDADDGSGIVTAITIGGSTNATGINVYATGFHSNAMGLNCATTAPLMQTFPECQGWGFDDLPWNMGGGLFVATFNGSLVGTSLLQPQINTCSAGMDIIRYSNRLYITGFYSGIMKFNSSAASQMPNTPGERDLFVCSVKAADNMALAFDVNDQQYGGANDAAGGLNKDIGYAVAANVNGVFVGGSCADVGGTYGSYTADQGPILLHYVFSGGAMKAMGDPLFPGSWINTIAHPGVNVDAAIRGLSASGNNLWATGNTNRNVNILGQLGSSVSLQGSNSLDDACGFLVNYDMTPATSGKIKWASRINDNGSATGNRTGRSIFVASCGLYYTGRVGGSNVKIGNAPLSLNAGGSDSFVACATSKLAQTANKAMTLPVGVGATVSLSAIAEGASTHAWSVSPAGPTFAPTNAANTTMSIPAGSGTVTYTATCTMTGTTLCSTTHTTKVTVTWSGMQGGGGEDGDGSDEATVVVEEPESNMAVLTLFPNPANNELTIRSSSALVDAEVLLMDATGRTIRRAQLPVGNGDAVLPISDLEPGTYVCVVLNAGVRMHTERVVVHH